MSNIQVGGGEPAVGFFTAPSSWFATSPGHPANCDHEAVTSIPWDLTQWVTAEELLKWVDEELGALDWNNPELVAHTHAHPKYQPRMMLSVITFAYASGLFESEEIVRRCNVEPRFRAMCVAGIPGSASAVRKFRRDNRGLLKWGLNQVLRRAFAAVTKNENMSYPPGLKRFLLENAGARVELARHLDRAG